MKEISKWIKNVYKFEKRGRGFEQMWCCFSRIVGFFYKDSAFCNGLRREWNYTSHTFQYLLDHYKFKEDLIFFNDKIGFYYPILKVFIWLFDPKRVIIEVNLDEPMPMIVSAPDILFEMFIAPRVIEENEREKII